MGIASIASALSSEGKKEEIKSYNGCRTRDTPNPPHLCDASDAIDAE